MSNLGEVLKISRFSQEELKIAISLQVLSWHFVKVTYHCLEDNGALCLFGHPRAAVEIGFCPHKGKAPMSSENTDVSIGCWKEHPRFTGGENEA